MQRAIGSQSLGSFSRICNINTEDSETVSTTFQFTLSISERFSAMVLIILEI